MGNLARFVFTRISVVYSEVLARCHEGYTSAR
jgi:hypothetical protein